MPDAPTEMHIILAAPSATLERVGAHIDDMLAAWPGHERPALEPRPLTEVIGVLGGA